MCLPFLKNNQFRITLCERGVWGWHLLLPSGASLMGILDQRADNHSLAAQLSTRGHMDNPPGSQSNALSPGEWGGDSALAGLM